MGSHEQLCLKWNDFESSIKTGFSKLRKQKEFFDVTIASNGRFMKAHKVILSACSPFFHQIIKNIPHDHPFIYLRDIKAEHLESLLCFMYDGEVNVSQNELENFLSVAEELQIHGLSQKVSASEPDLKKRKLNRISTKCNPEVLKSSPSSHKGKVSEEKDSITLYDEEIVPDDEYIEEEHENFLPNDSKIIKFHYDTPSGEGNSSTSSQSFEKNKSLNKNELDIAIDKLICKSPNGHIYCTRCDYSTALQRSIRDHIEAKHIVTDGFECDQCSLRCKTRASLRRHHYRRHPKISNDFII
ncbi:uncharacterized protein [Lepeophtheirus salmonis]|uniref:uncharacterized protein n=1 Tax=Lepeophtheirus salmonis TaxID=72036 RepID=UPI001AE9113B|nr:broad-complex core protein isoforms 1/2/3/4/5-like [Lepeophtheirus salmonis]